MYLTQHTDYAMRVLIYTAINDDALVNISTIADTYGISKSHLMKVVTALVKGGFLASVRGKGGGLELAMPPELIGVGDVVRAAEGEPLPAECFGEGGGQCRIGDVCRLRGVLGEAVNAFYAALDAYTLADLVHNRSALASILFVPMVQPGTAPRQ